MLQADSVPSAGRPGRRVLVTALGLLLLGACSGKVKQKEAERPFVKFALEAEPLKKVYGTRWNDPEPITVKLTLRNNSEYMCDALNRFIPAAMIEPGVVSPLAVSVTYDATKKAIPLERYDDPERPVAADFVTMEARYALTCEVNLKDYFPQMREPGAYTVQFHYRFGDKEAAALKEDKQFKKIVPWSGQIAAKPVTIFLVGVPEPTPTPTPKPTPTPQPKKSGEHGGGEGHGESASHGESGGHGTAPAEEGHGAVETPKPVGIGSVIVPPPTPEPTPDPTPVPTPEPPQEEHGGHGGHGEGHGGEGHHE